MTTLQYDMNKLEHYRAYPRGVFRGTNFMTPHILGHYKVKHNGRSVFVELSTGEGMDREPMWGVTVRTPGGENITTAYPGERDPSRCFRALSNAVVYILDMNSVEESA